MSRQDFGPKNWIFPEPALVIATYNEDGSVDAMTAAWAGICQENPCGVMIDLDPAHVTTENIKRTKAFTLAIPTVELVAQTDFFGIVSAKDDPKKFEKSGLTARRSDRVDAPIIEEYKMVLECKLYEIFERESELRVVGEIVNVSVDESALSDGKIDVAKLRPIAWNPVSLDYHALGEPVGRAWTVGRALMKEGE